MVDRRLGNEGIELTAANSDADGDVNTGGQVELLQLIDGAGGWIDDVEDALVGADLELFHRLLVDVHGAVHAELLDAGRERDRAGHLGAGALGGLDNLRGRAVDGAVIEGAQADADLLVFHGGGCGLRVGLT